MVDEFAFLNNQTTVQVETPKSSKKEINFQEMPKGTEELLSIKNQQDLINKFTKEEPIAIPLDNNTGTSYLNLVLSPNLRDLELMIRGLEYCKRFNPLTGRDEVILRRIENHPLNEFGVNKIMEFLKIYTSPELKLGRKTERDAIGSVQQVGYDIVRLVYKNLKNFGMDTQTKQRNAKTFCLAIIEVTHATFSRSIGGRENDLSRATELKIEGNINPTDLYHGFTKDKKEQLKN